MLRVLAYRLLQTLDEHNLVEREGARYRLALALQHLGTRVADGVEIRHQAMPHLEYLHEKTGENAELHTRREETRVPIELVRSTGTSAGGRVAAGQEVGGSPFPGGHPGSARLGIRVY